MGIYDPARPRVTVDAEHLLVTVLSGEMPPGVTVTFAPEAEQLDFAAMPDEDYPLVIVTMIGGGDIPDGNFRDGDIWDIGIHCLDVNRDDEPSSHANASTLSDIVMERLYSLARRQAGAPGIGSIHTVENTERPTRVFTATAGDKQRTMFAAQYAITVRPSRRSPINPS
jgi:hypothetical protein